MAVFGTPPPIWMASMGEPGPSRPTSRLSQPIRSGDPGSASSTSSIAEKCDRLATGSPVAWIAAIFPPVHSGSRGASDGCRPNMASFASSRSLGTLMEGRAR